MQTLRSAADQGVACCATVAKYASGRRVGEHDLVPQDDPLRAGSRGPTGFRTATQRCENRASCAGCRNFFGWRRLGPRTVPWQLRKGCAFHGLALHGRSLQSATHDDGDAPALVTGLAHGSGTQSDADHAFAHGDDEHGRPQGQGAAAPQPQGRRHAWCGAPGVLRHARPGAEEPGRRGAGGQRRDQP